MALFSLAADCLGVCLALPIKCCVMVVFISGCLLLQGLACFHMAVLGCQVTWGNVDVFACVVHSSIVQAVL